MREVSIGGGHGLLRRLAKAVGAVGGGLALAASFPPLGWWVSAIVGLALLAWVQADPLTGAAGGFGYGLLFGLAFYLPLLPWIGALVGPLPWVALAVVCALFPAAFAVPAVLLRGVTGWPLWWAAWWVAIEWLKSVFPFGGFPWGVVGFSQADGPLAVVARLGGVALVSFTTALLGFCVAALALLVRRSMRTDLKGAVAVPVVCLALITIATAAMGFMVRASTVNGGPSVTVAVVQGNVPRLGLDFNAQRRAVLDNHVRQTLRLADDIRSGRAPQPQFVIWPENSSDIDPLLNEDAGRQITRVARAVGAPVLVGAVVARPEWSPSTPVSSNSVIVWDPVSGPGQRHDKKIVQPFGEYLPWRGFFRHFSDYADRAGYFTAGDGSGIVQAGGVPVGVTTCWEVIFDRAAREAVLNGAQMLAVPSNNATFNEQMSRQQLAFAKIRAIEHGRSVVVAGTTGISAVITPQGRVVADTGFFEPAYLVNRIPLQANVTPATRWAAQVQRALIAIAAATLIVTLLGRVLSPPSPTGDVAGSADRHVNGWVWQPTRRA
ncbi:apolipoprotein N-acyltransferase [Mycolicibacterium rhodesiae NBB3]|uniref:Apolipoprotein N-acyltransferase n=1 Tax=Mycolicibacterium rhodesiae (strain NBB3) TaxID=710685 RepID=G8RI23_MYCRN|nr:apolipoprotein N-acyltransferase [Mycolicibacterium rhodesiae]AEV73360.1 apolipoprotein N-acyltransferase [Mycolicibacterium rhodesiae NBB3]